MNLALIPELKEAENQDLLVICISDETQNLFVPQVIYVLPCYNCFSVIAKLH